MNEKLFDNSVQRNNGALPNEVLQIVVENPPDCPYVGNIGLERVQLAAGTFVSDLKQRSQELSDTSKP